MSAGWMSRQSKYLKIIATMDPGARLDQAKKVIQHLTTQAVDLVHLHESNQLLVFSDQVTNKVPDGQAAQALNTVRSACVRYEVIRLLAMWDRADEDAMSIPTGIELLDDDRVVHLVHTSTYEALAAVEPRILNPEEDPLIQEEVLRMVRASQEAFAAEQAQKAETSLRKAITKAKAHAASDNFVAASNLRNHLAHALSQTRAERNGYMRTSVHGEEVTALLRESVSLIEAMYCWVNGTSFDISGNVRDQAQRYAARLWDNLHFELKDDDAEA